MATAALLATAIPAQAATPTFKEYLTHTGFKTPWGMAFDGSGNLFVTDAKAKALDAFDSSGSFTGAVATFPKEFARSVAASTASGGDLYLAESGEEKIDVFKPSGGGAYQKLEERGSTCWCYLATDNSSGSHGGYLYSTARGGVSGGGKVVAYATGGEGRLEAGEEHLAAPPEGFALFDASFNGGLAVDSATSTLYVSNPGKHTIDVYDTNTASATEPPAFVKAITGAETPSGSQFTPSAIAVDEATGLLYVLDAADVQESVDVFDSAGAYEGALEEAGGGGHPFKFDGETEEGALGIAVQNAAVAGKGQVYVSTGKRIAVFNPGTPSPHGPALTVKKAGTGTGTVSGGSTAFPAAISCDPACSEQVAKFEAGELVTLKAEEATHSEFSGWSGCESEPEGKCQVTMSAAHEVTATFAQVEHAPTIEDLYASAVTSESAALGALIDPFGLPTSYRFEYGTSEAYGQTASGSAGQGNEAVTRTAALQGLLPATTYHYRLIVENSLGGAQSEDRTFTTQPTSPFALPDSRAWELVSPPNKHGSPLEPITEEGAVVQAAADGSGLAYAAKGPVTEDPPSSRSPFYTQLLSHRAPGGGWSTEDITPPREEISAGTFGVGVYDSEYRQFSPDLSSALVEPAGATALSPLTTERTPYRREADGTYVPLVTAANVPPGTRFGGFETETGGGGWSSGVQFETATPDLSHAVLSSQWLLAPGFQPGFEANGKLNLYELSAGALTLISEIPPGSEPSCGPAGPACSPAAEAGLAAGLGSNGENMNMRGAISANGSRVVFEVRSRGLYLRDTTRGETLRLDAAQGLPEPEHPGARFQDASADGRRVFFTDPSRLTADSTAQPSQSDLYMCEVQAVEGSLECRLSDLSVDPNPGEAANLPAGSMVSIDSSGEHVFFAANGVLTDEPNEHGEVAAPGDCNELHGAEATCNLYVYDTATHRIDLVAVLSSRDNPDWGSGPGLLHRLGNLTARSSPDGRFFTFMSKRPLTGYDNRDAASGQRDEEVFLYDAAAEAGKGKLTCPSCNPTGARPHGVFDPEMGVGIGFYVDRPGSWGNRGRAHWLAATIPGWTLRSQEIATYQSRYLSDSGRLFFNSADALAPTDTNGAMDVYQYEPPGVGSCTAAAPSYSPTSGGCVGLISSGASAEESAFLDASENGNDVFFLTASRLTAKDVDAAYDVYDARVGGGEPAEAKPVECAGDACQAPARPPLDLTPGTFVVNGPGNVHEASHHRKRHHRKKHRKHHKNRRRATSRHRMGSR